MIRYFYSALFLVIGTGLPLSAKYMDASMPTRPASSKAGTKSIPASCVPSSSSVAQAKTQICKKSVVTVTSDLSRAAVAAASASKPQPPAALVAKTAPAKATHRAVHRSIEPSVLVARHSPSIGKAAAVSSVRTEADPVQTPSDERLARVTAYWADEGDYYTGRRISATGVRLHDGDCAVDPNIIPYGSVVEIAGVGKFLAVDTGSAVISRTAAREGGHTSAERHAIVVDLFFEDRSEGERFAASDAKYVAISWWTPSSMGVEAKAARSLFAEEDWTKIQSKQL